MKIISVMLDNSVVQNSVITQPTVVNKTIKWGGRDYTLPLSVWERKPNLSPDQAWRQKQINCIPTLVRLYREGKIAFYTYTELVFERWSGEIGMSGTFGDLFSSVKKARVPPAVERSRFRSMSLEECCSREDVIEFCKFLLKLNPKILQENPEVWDLFPEFEKKNLMQLDRFKLFCRTLTENHYPDAFHLWTAETNKLDYFLMIEKKFPNLVKNNHIEEFNCIPVTPEMLLQRMGIEMLDPMPLPDDKPHYYR